MSSVKLPSWANDGRAIAVCAGLGVDSTAMMIKMVEMRIRPDFITFADTGAEVEETYDYLPYFNEYLRDNDFPEIQVCSNGPKTQATADRYNEAVDECLKRLKITVSDKRRKQLGLIYGNLIANATLPSIAYGMKGCSVRYKLEAQEPL